MTDSDNELDKILTSLENAVQTEPVVFQPEMKKAIKKLVAAPHQALIEEVEKRLPKPKLHTILDQTTREAGESAGFNSAIGQVSETLAMIKKEIV